MIILEILPLDILSLWVSIFTKAVERLLQTGSRASPMQSAHVSFWSKPPGYR